MSGNLKKYKARIFGEQYSIVSDGSEAFVTKVVTKVDNLMKNISEKTKDSDPRFVAVLAALKATEELSVLKEVLEKEESRFEKTIALLNEEEKSF